MIDSKKNYFASGGQAYAHARPDYPQVLFDWLAALTVEHNLAWDCACGGGQATHMLVEHYLQILATDASSSQIEQAVMHPRIEYRVADATQSGLSDKSCDLITVAQALHWFALDGFYKEVQRVAKPQAIIAAWTYQLLQADDEITRDFAKWYRTIAKWWPPQRRWVDSGYQGMPFPFTEIAAPQFFVRRNETLKELLEYVRTWSAVRALQEAESTYPVAFLEKKLQAVWARIRIMIKIVVSASLFGRLLCG